MSGRIRFEYKCKDIPEKIFFNYIKADYTVEQVLEVIRKKRGNYYKFLFDEFGALCDNNDDIIDYWEQEHIFIASLDDEPPEIFPQGKPIPLKISNPLPPKLWPPHKYAQTVGSTIELPNTYYFYFTGSTKNHLSYGIQVNLDGSMNFEQCHAKLVELLRKQKVDVDDKRLLIFFSGGIPFVYGTLDDIYKKNKDLKRQSHIYGVLTRKISDDDLYKSYDNICDSSSSDRKLLISPLCDSSERGLSDMACLLGYLNNDGKKKDLILRICAELTNFAPLIISLYKICRKEKVNGLDIVTVCSTLFTYLRNCFPTDKFLIMKFLNMLSSF